MALLNGSATTTPWFVFVVTAVTVAISVGSTSGTSHRRLLAGAANATDEFLAAHNEARAAVGVQPLRWSSMLAVMASRLARYQRNNKSCGFADMSGSKFGANQAFAAGMLVSPKEVVEFWAEKKKYYNHDTNTCDANKNCGVYLQVVWKKSLELGCGQAVCRNGTVSSITICLYNPPGNVQGEAPY